MPSMAPPVSMHLVLAVRVGGNRYLNTSVSRTGIPIPLKNVKVKTNKMRVTASLPTKILLALHNLCLGLSP